MDIIERLQEMLNEEHGIDDATPTDTFDTIGLDSLDLVEMIICCEEVWNIEIPDQDVANLKTLQDLADYLENRGV